MTNPPSFRLPFTLPDDVHPAVAQAIRYLYNGLAVHEQAFVEVNSKIAAAQSTATTAQTTATQANTVATSAQTTANATASQSTPGGVNDQTGATSYILQQSDFGSLVILSSASPISLSANAGVNRGFYTKIWNNGSSAITVTVTDPVGSPTGQTINGSATITIAAGTTKDVRLNTTDYNWSAV